MKSMFALHFGCVAVRR